MNQPEHPHLSVHTEAGIAHITIDNPPVNVLSFEVMTELSDVMAAIASDNAVRVIVFDSANPEFFIAHVDMTLGSKPEQVATLVSRAPEGLNPFQALSEQLRHQPQVTIVKLAGLARGGGAEFVTAADMSFAAIGSAGLGQIEALMGIVPGGGGTQYLDDRVRRHRALEIVLGADLFDAETAERYGWVNRAVPAHQIDEFVARLAQNIASLPEGVVSAAKRALPPADLAGGMARETEEWTNLVFGSSAGDLMAQGLARGAQTPDGERDLEGLFRQLRAG